jgi:hypothetical protein
MPNRRKFLAGLGALASGSAAAVGTGAFTSVSANRTLSVETAGDVDAYLGLDASVSPHANQSGGPMEFQFDGSSEAASGQGLNQNADTTFTDVLRIENQGTEPFRLQLYSGTGSGAFGSFAQGPLVVSYSDDELAPKGKSQISSTVFDNSPDAPSYWAGSTGNVNNQDLGVGEDLYVHFSFFLSDRTDFGANNDPADIPEQIIFYADSTAAGSTNFS